MKLLNFDTHNIINLQQLALDSEKEWKNKKNLEDNEGYILIYTLVDGLNQLKHPFSICDYFGVPYNLKNDGEFIWVKVDTIRKQVSFELDNLMTNGSYKLDWSCSNHSFSIFYKKTL